MKSFIVSEIWARVDKCPVCGGELDQPEDSIMRPCPGPDSCGYFTLTNIRVDGKVDLVFTMIC